MICLDSTILIDHLKGKKEAQEALERYEKEGLCITEFSVFEVAEGVLYAQEKHKEKKLSTFIDFISQFNILSSMNLFAMDAAKLSAQMSLKGTPVGSIDCLIAGVMQANGVTKILSNNKKHFERFKEIEVITY